MTEGMLSKPTAECFEMISALPWGIQSYMTDFTKQDLWKRVDGGIVTVCCLN